MGGYVQNVARLDNQTPPRPDGAGGRQRHVLRQRQLLRRPPEVADAGEDNAPLIQPVSSQRPVSIAPENVNVHRTFMIGALIEIVRSASNRAGLHGKETTAMAHQKCTVFRPTGLVHSFWNRLCGAAGVDASVTWYLRPMGRRRVGARARRACCKIWRPTRDDMVAAGIASVSFGSGVIRRRRGW